MSADLLRRAAAKLRENAGKASKPSWTAADDGLVWPDCMGDPVSGSQELENAYYIEMMHPAVALALATTMERVARVVGPSDNFVSRERGPAGYSELVEVARAVLREPGPTGGAG